MSDPCNDHVLNIDGQPITLDEILEDTSLYFNPAFLQSCDPVFPSFDVTYTEDTKANVTILDLKDVYEKGQMRRNANSEQRLLDAEVHLMATSQKPIQDVRAYVERCPEAARILQDMNGRVSLNLVYSKKDLFVANFAVNLDSVYSNNGIKVYELSRVKGEERNIFRVIVVLHFADGTTKEFISKSFQVQSRKNAKQESEEDLVSVDNGYCGTPSPENNRKKRKMLALDTSPSGSWSSGMNSDCINAAEIITNRLDAQSALINELRVKKPILTQKGDIAYHFKLNKTELDLPLEEGDIIGFFESSSGNTHIEKLTQFNASKAKMAGVISRSAYLEARTPADGEEKGLDDLVCVIGMVNVKVLGPVKNGERIFASLEHSGVAIPQSRLNGRMASDAFLLGQTLERRDAEENDVNLVQSFVSILLSITSSHMAEAASDDLRKHVREDVKTEVNKMKKKCFSGLRRWLFAGFILAVLLGVLLYQLFVPGTALRYYRCRQGSIEGSELWFTFTTTDFQIPRVHCIEFTFDKLKEKMGLNFGRINYTDAHYYLNLDRCAYGGIRHVRSHLDNKEMVRGAEVVAVDHNCTTVYFHSEVWTPYESGRDIVCNTHPTKPELKEND
ncbi:uncharacterized protein LOC111332759 [Stylophora pistillata]|uniref:Uncharacterized protein n=1 Tax=Stylophora pistillata TaxID=50429 RepID=A0A2B4S3I4_STYPI|nr:uncharacterized protein LOC111332759 [Stylophora pistillata]PFX23603.1 hypothetical protein AWC38_SpisGene11839 [Stylophora pistillata]